MIFIDEMKKLTADYENELSHKDEKEIEKYMIRLKNYIRNRVARGEKVVSQENWLLFRADYPEYVEIEPRMGLLGATIRWSLTSKAVEKLKSIEAVAAKEGITITGFSFVLGNGHGDDASSYDYNRFYADYGVLRIPKNYCAPYVNTIKNPREWHVYVSISFCFSI